LATVKGDIHDIGKNIVALLLRNYHFNVLDLGKDVPAETIVETALKNNAAFIGLSALMTTTMPQMRVVAELARSKGFTNPIIVGGAAVDEAFAETIGAVYAADAMATVRAALTEKEK
ncbi:MAG: cobalamin-dependent protein, partial [Lentisphaeria bacterium]|nr:cobalamin-dependent protein [Lentisphaeria bacterium]